MNASTPSVAHDPVIIERSVAFDRIALAAALSLPIGNAVYSGLASGGIAAVIALPFVALALRNVLFKPPLLRGDARGLWFGRGRIVPWQEISLIYETKDRQGTEGIGFEFRRRSTWLRLPLEKQLMSLYAYGQTGVTTRYETRASRTLLISRLEAMRTRAIGTEDDVVVGAAAIPSARLIDRTR